MSLPEGTAIGPYRIVRKIGEGGMGAVYLAHHSLIGRPAAIKVLLPALSSQREVVDRFFNEARATTAVNDPGIVQVFDFGFHVDNSAYIVMEMLEGESLDARIHRRTLAIVDALRITRQVAGSLAAAHARGIVHRDLKPDNLFMVRDAEAQSGERTKILDFGIAKLTSDAPDRTRTRTGTIMGTPVYMSPEQCRGSGVVDHRSDIYSLGCVLYHMLTGHPPFDLEGMGEILAAHLREEPKPPSMSVAGITPAVDELVLRCLAKAPEHRFQSMTELQTACEAQLARISGAGAQTIALPSAMASRYPSGVVAPAQPTTLSRAAGEAPVQPRRRGGAWLAAIAVVGIAIAVVVTLNVRAGARGGDDHEVAPASAPRAAVALDGGVELAAPAATADAAVAMVSVDAALPVDAATVATHAPDAGPPATVSKPSHASHRGHAAAPPQGTTPQGDLYDIR